MGYKCFVCSCPEYDSATDEYRRCTNCGHETLLATDRQGFIINDVLSNEYTRRITSLDRFKSRVLSQFDADLNRQLLLDIGSASGKFLYHNGSRYANSIGIEISPESLKYSRQTLDLNIVENIDDVPDGIAMVTAWHSLEHIPANELIVLLDTLSHKIISGGRLVASVPNGASRQYRWFGTSYAFFDVPNHLHQFTPTSLECLLHRFGFHTVQTVSSWPYNKFGYIQGLLNMMTKTHNYLYYRLKRRSLQPSWCHDVSNGFLLIIAAPLGWLLGLFDTVDLKHQGVITTCFEKKNC